MRLLAEILHGAPHLVDLLVHLLQPILLRLEDLLEAAPLAPALPARRGDDLTDAHHHVPRNDLDARRRKGFEETLRA